MQKVVDQTKRQFNTMQTALANAPQSGAGYFKVPKVIE